MRGIVACYFNINWNNHWIYGIVWTVSLSLCKLGMVVEKLEQKLIMTIQILKHCAFIGAILFLIFMTIQEAWGGGHAGSFFPPDIVPHPMPENPIHHPDTPRESEA